VEKLKIEEPEVKNKSQDISSVQGLRVWQDSEGRLCVGSDCFYVRPDKEKVTIVVGEKCPVTVEKLSEGQKLDKSEESQ
jgi:hypothetical protein